MNAFVLDIFQNKAARSGGFALRNRKRSLRMTLQPRSFGAALYQYCGFNLFAKEVC